MALLTTQQVTRAGINPTLAAAAGGGDSCRTPAETDSVFLWVQNTDATTASTVTIVTPGTTEGQAIADVAVTVPVGSSRLVGPITPGLFGNTSGQVTWTYSSVTGVNVGVFSV